MTNNIKKLSIIFIILLLVNVTIFTTTQGENHYKNQQGVQQNLKQGEKYLPYCEGGISETIVAETDDGCIADYPGSFARTVVPIGSFIILLVSSFFIFKRKEK